jgi:hypothetical protein
MFTLSDQQLVTGPAIILAALVQHCQLSVYEFQVVNSLAFLSSTKHLATLVMLRQYLRENKVVRNIRVTAMVLNLGLLIYTTIVAYTAFTVDSSQVECVMDSLSSLRSDPVDFANIVITCSFLSIMDRISSSCTQMMRTAAFSNDGFDGIVATDQKDSALTRTSLNSGTKMRPRNQYSDQEVTHRDITSGVVPLLLKKTVEAGTSKRIPQPGGSTFNSPSWVKYQLYS